MATEYWLKGTVRARRFQLTVSQAPAEVIDNATESETTPGDSVATEASRASAATTTSPALVFCEYTDEDNVYHSGDCATQQEIDDAYVAAIAMDDEASGVEADGGNDIYYCQTVLNQCWETEDDSQPERAEPEGAPADDEIGYLRAPASPYSALEGCSFAEDCTVRAASFIGAAAWYGHSAWKLWGVISAIAPPAGALTGAVVAAGASLVAVIATGIALNDCVFAQ